MRFVFALAVLLSPLGASAREEDRFARDILILTDWFEGIFDNEEQVWFHKRSGAEGEPHLRIHAIHERVDLPSFGEHVFYVEEYKNNDPEDVWRQRLVIFESDPEENAIRMRLGFFNDPKAVLGAAANPDLLSALGDSDVSFIENCDVFWRRHADQFEGSMKPKACVFGEGEDRRYSVHDLTLSENKYWRVDSTLRVKDDSIFIGRPLDEPFEMRRARTFSCTVTFQGAQDTGFQSGVDHVREGLPLHSQGGTLTVTNPSDGRDYQLLMRTKEYDFYENRPDFMYFSIRKPGESTSTAFGVGDTDSRLIGLNLGWMSAFCYREGYTFREPLAVLNY